MAPEVVYEDKDMIAVNKPAGFLVHKTVRNEQEETVADWVRARYPETAGVGDPSTGSGQANERPGIVHRLDKDSSGVLIIARNQKFFDYLKNLFQTHKVQKGYLAFVWGEVKTGGVIDKPIGLRPGSVKRSVSARRMKMVKAALTEYKLIETRRYGGETFSLLHVFPKTGRTHQIRVHLAAIGHPIVGDPLYGPKKNPFGLARQFLHAESIEFTKEDGKRLKLEAGLPPELEEVLEKAS